MVYHFTSDIEVNNAWDDECWGNSICAAAEIFQCVSLHKWMKYTDLQDWLDVLLRTDFCDKSSRKNAAVKFRLIPRERDIFNKTKRFPVDSYVSMGNKKISDLILGIMSHLDDVSSGDINVSNRDFIDAVKKLNMVFCLTSYHELAEYGIFTRESFENYYSVEWKE
ncbi:uncharacterized protein LOC129921090 [Episyrphus balteatus]|uniref:uncharacterized protein LOC129921090 n=1 Tax=Episyrphus balteatus TaxID=286459 RepID=UPI0024862D48|nr:uncharacterized protein LOC129921090 [Episyrphus balteatus]